MVCVCFVLFICTLSNLLCTEVVSHSQTYLHASFQCCASAVERSLLHPLSFQYRRKTEAPWLLCISLNHSQLSGAALSPGCSGGRKGMGMPTEAVGQWQAHTHILLPLSQISTEHICWRLLLIRFLYIEFIPVL